MTVFANMSNYGLFKPFFLDKIFLLPILKGVRPKPDSILYQEEAKKEIAARVFACLIFAKT
jgi:hypothetical protein